MKSRRTFLRSLTSGLFLPAAYGQVLINNNSWREPSSGQGKNWDAVDFFTSNSIRGYGWQGDPIFQTSSGNPPTHVTNVSTFEGDTPGYLIGQLSRYIRKLSIGNNWTKIRLVSLYSVLATSAPADYGVLLAVANFPNVLFVGSTQNGVGCFHGTGGSGWTYSGGSGAYILSGSSDSYAMTDINGVSNFISYGAPTAGVNVMTAQTGHKNMQVLDITKGSPNYTVDSYAIRAAGNANYDFTFKNLNDALVATGGADMGFSGPNGSSTLTFKTTTIAMSESAGALNAAYCSFGGGTAGFPSYLYAIAVKKLA